MKKALSLLLTLLLAAPQAWGVGKVQQQGVKTATDCTNAGATIANCLLLDSQIYDSTNSQKLSDSISQGRLGGGGAPGSNLIPLDTAANNWASTKLTNSNLESSVGDWLAFANAASATPGTLTGGSPNTTCTRNTSSPLNGVADLKMTITTGATRQGEGCSLLVNVPVAYRGKTLSFTMPFATTGTISSGDLIPAAYDVTNSVSLSTFIASPLTGSAGTGNMVFQTSSSTAQIRVGFYIARASNTGAVTMNSDDIQVATAIAVQGISDSDWIAYTPTLSAGFGTTTGVSFFYRRSGDSVEIMGTFTDGTTSGTIATATLPAGVAVDSTKTSVANTTSNPGPWMGYYFTGNGSNQNGPMVTATGTSTSLIYFGQTYNVGTAGTPDLVSNIFPSNKQISLYAKVPVSGWGTAQSGVNLANRSQVTVTEGNGHGATNTKIRRFANSQLSAGADITYADSASLGGSFTINTTGVYAISYTDYRNTTVVQIGISVNTSAPTTSIASLTYAQGYRGETRVFVGDTSPNFSTVLILNAGDVVRAHTDGNPSGTSASEPTIFNITKVNDLALFNGANVSNTGMACAITEAPNATWSTSMNTSYGQFTAASSFTSNTATAGITTCSVPSTIIPGVKVASLVPGTYKVTAIGDFLSGATGLGGAWTIYDGTTYGQLNGLYTTNAGSGASSVPQIVSYFTYAAGQTNITFQIAAKTASSSGTFYIGDYFLSSLSFLVERIY